MCERSTLETNTTTENRCIQNRFLMYRMFIFRHHVSGDICFYVRGNMDLKEIGINARNWVDSAQVRDYWRALVKAALNLRVP